MGHRFHLVIALAAVALAACTRTSASEASLAAPPPHRTLTYAGGNHEHLDPAKIAETAGHHLMLNVFEGLYLYNRGDGPPVPAMATHHEVSADGLRYRFHLRDGLRWSDGKVLTAHDFVFSWRRVLDPKTASRSGQLLWVVAGAQAYNEGKTSDPASVLVRAPDDRTLTVTLTRPTPYFPQLVCEMPYVATPRHVVEKLGDAWARPATLVHNGAFSLVEDEPRKRTVLVRNPRYWDAGNVFLDRIEMLATESEQTLYDWYEVGRTQWGGDWSLPLDKVPALRASGRPDFHTDPKLCSYYFSLRVDRPPLDDVRVRRALDLGIDKERLVLHVLQGGQSVATNAVPDLFQKSHGYKVLQGSGFDPERARRLLAEAGYPRGIGLPTIELLHNTGEGHRVLAEFVQRNLQDNLGVRVTLVNLEWGTLLKTLKRGDFAIGRASWCADYPDPLTFLEVFHSAAPSNYGRYKSSEYDEVLRQIQHEPDTAKRNGYVRQAETILARDVPFVPIYHYTWSYLIRPWVLGYERHAQDQHPLKYVRWATEAELNRIQAGEELHLPPLPGAVSTVVAEHAKEGNTPNAEVR
jgi:oligopeptide transport system substrate-binding protein